MRKISIELPDVITIVSRGVSVDMPTKGLSADIIARLAVHGATQKVADAASGAAKLVSNDTTIEAATESLMVKARDAVLAGEWTQRTGGGVDEFTRFARSVTRSAIKAKVGGGSDKWKAFAALPDAEQNAKLDANFAANEATLRPVVEQRIAEAKAARDERAKLGNAVDIDL